MYIAVSIDLSIKENKRVHMTMSSSSKGKERGEGGGAGGPARFVAFALKLGSDVWSCANDAARTDDPSVLYLYLDGSMCWLKNRLRLGLPLRARNVGLKFRVMGGDWRLFADREGRNRFHSDPVVLTGIATYLDCAGRLREQDKKLNAPNRRVFAACRETSKQKVKVD